GVNTDDAEAGFGTGGEHISGSYSAVDSNNNPYGYGVDSFSAYLNADVTNGYIDTGCARTASYVSMYGSDGQHSWSYVGIGSWDETNPEDIVWVPSTGTASMAYRTTTNYAGMIDAGYKFQLPGGHNIVVDADYYELSRGINDGEDSSGILNAWGSGSAILDCMVSGASGNGGVHFGLGGGCYTDANFSAAGSGHFDVTGTGNNSITFSGLGMSSGGGSLAIIADYVNNFSIGDYSLTAW
ncbi:unnamed protein product, partial [marine sediment metagenome]